MATKVATHPGCEAPRVKERLSHAPPVQKLPKEPSCEVLNRADYPEWDDLIDRSPHGTVFHYSWWLKTTAADFTILVIRNERGAIVAGIPIPSERRTGL